MIIANSITSSSRRLTSDNDQAPTDFSVLVFLANVDGVSVGVTQEMMEAAMVDYKDAVQVCAGNVDFTVTVTHAVVGPYDLVDGGIWNLMNQAKPIANAAHGSGFWDGFA